MAPLEKRAMTSEEDAGPVLSEKDLAELWARMAPPDRPVEAVDKVSGLSGHRLHRKFAASSS